MAFFSFCWASSLVLAARTALMAVRILFFSAELRMVRRLVRRTSLIDDLMIGMDPPVMVSRFQKRRQIVNERRSAVKNGPKSRLSSPGPPNRRESSGAFPRRIPGDFHQPSDRLFP